MGCIGMATSGLESRNQPDGKGLATPARVGLVVAVLLAASLTLTAQVYAKGPVDKITLAGEGLTEPIEITDAESLAPFDPWMRGFIDWNRGRIAEPPPVEEAYEVSFHLADRGTIYVMQYLTDTLGGPGYIYIPGPGDPWYSLNMGTIMGGSSDAWDPNGKWHHAKLSWGMLVQKALNSTGNVPTPPAAVGPGTATTVWVLALGALLLFSAAASGVAVAVRVGARQS